jgi:hypothetical protein
VTRSSATRGMPPGSRFSAAILCATTLGAMQVLVACGDPMLPSDYVGPPAANVSGVVFSSPSATITPDALHPQMSLEWLTTLGNTTGAGELVGQPLRLKRSERIQSDWDIGLETPVDGAKLPAAAMTSAASGTGPRVGVGKMIYFDDRNGNGRLDWSCAGFASACDQIKAVSREFVAFVDAPVACGRGLRGETGVQYSAGYHYFRMDGLSLYKLNEGESMSFVLGDRTLAEGNPSAELRSFASTLLWLIARGPLNPC